MSSSSACRSSVSTMVRSSSLTSKSFPSGRRSSLGGAHPRPLLLPLLVVFLVGFFSSSENTAGGSNHGRSNGFVWMVAGAVEDEANEEAANGPGGCYDMTIHECNCNPESCSAELCQAANMFWTADCPEPCDPEKCPAASFVMVTGGDAVTEDFIPVVPGDGGACYDVTIHKCNCTADTCSAESCAAGGMIWSADCPDHCNPEECPSAATSSSSASTTTLEEEKTTNAVEAPTTTSGSSSNEEADTTTTTSTDPADEASSGSSMRAAAATATTVATIGAAVVAALL